MTIYFGCIGTESSGALCTQTIPGDPNHPSTSKSGGQPTGGQECIDLLNKSGVHPSTVSLHSIYII